jgi:short-subunit dehydrogenase
MAIALVTGASGGIGLELAKVLAREGYDLALVARSAKTLDDVATKIRSQYKREVSVIVEDVSAAGGAERIFAKIPSAEILVNNAGFGLVGEFAKLDRAQQLNMVDLNIRALTELTHLYLPGMIQRGRGGILNVASTAAFQAGPWMTIYYATKAYVLAFTEGIAEELRGTGVFATALCPGPVVTSFQKRAGMEGSKMLKGPLVMSADQVAEYGYRSLRAGKVIAIAGTGNALVAWSNRLVPRSISRRLAMNLNKID